MRRFLLLLLVLVFALGFAGEVMGRSLLDAAFSRETYQSAASGSQLLEDVRRQASQQITAALTQSGDLSLLLSADDVQWIVEQTITETWLDSQLQGWLTGLAGWLQDDASEPRFLLDVAEPKARAPLIVEERVVENLEALPICDLPRAAEAIRALLEGRQIPLCRPPGIDVRAAVTSGPLDVSVMTEQALAAVPDEVDLWELSAQDPEFRGRVLEALATVRRLRQTAYRILDFAALALVGLLVLIALLGSYSRRSRLQWLAVALLLGGVLTLLTGWTLTAESPSLWEWSLWHWRLPDIPLQPVHDAFVRVVTTAWDRSLWIGAAAVATGLLLGLISLAVPRAGVSARGR